MDKVSVTFQRNDGSMERTLNISLSEKFSEFRKEIQTLLGLRDDIPCELILNRTGKILVDSVTPSEASVRSGDKIILIPFIGSVTNINSSLSDFSKVQVEREALSLVKYKLQLTIPSDGHQTDTYEYPIELTEFYEDNPQRFFSDANSQEKQNFITQLQEKVPKQIKSFEIDKILQQWCEDISLGYRFTSIRI